MEKKKPKKLLSLKTSQTSKTILDECVSHMKLRKGKAYEKLITDLKDPKIRKEFFKFAKEYKVRRITIEPVPVSIYLSEEVYKVLDIDKYAFHIHFNSQFFKFLFYSYFHKNIRDLKLFNDLDIAKVPSNKVF